MKSLYFGQNAVSAKWNLDEAARDVVDYLAAPIIERLIDAETAHQLILAAERYVAAGGNLTSFEYYDRLNSACIKSVGGEGVNEEFPLDSLKGYVIKTATRSKNAYMVLSEALIPIIKSKLESHDEWDLITDFYCDIINNTLFQEAIHQARVRLCQHYNCTDMESYLFLKKDLTIQVYLKFKGKELLKGSIDVPACSSQIMALYRVAGNKNSYFSTMPQKAIDIVLSMLRAKNPEPLSEVKVDSPRGPSLC
jgi:hypothetical protein